MMSLKERITEDMKAAMKAKDAERLGVEIIDEDAWLRLIGG